jgi:hypothetical protein
VGALARVVRVTFPAARHLVPMLLVSFAFAESAAVLPAHAAVVYVGGGFTTFSGMNTGDTGGFEAERFVSQAAHARVDLYGAWSPVQRLELALSAPVVYSTHLAGALGPCDTPVTEDCSPHLLLGTTSLRARFGILDGPVRLSVAGVVASQAWNADIRGDWSMVGEATTDLAPWLHAGVHGGDTWRWELNFAGGYVFRLPAENDPALPEKAPHDDIRALLDLRVARGPVALTLSASTLQRLGGSSFYEYGATEDRWAAVDYDNVAAGLKLSADLGPTDGLHLGVSRALWVHNGPVDATDLTLGWHHWFAPR